MISSAALAHEIVSTKAGAIPSFILLSKSPLLSRNLFAAAVGTYLCVHCEHGSGPGQGCPIVDALVLRTSSCPVIQEVNRGTSLDKSISPSY